ncbi:MAG: hypothetical protein GXO48_04380 [Chlorobi bacterium]|nr:hypothetical protein [Chlorobiota bacterium]
MASSDPTKRIVRITIKRVNAVQIAIAIGLASLFVLYIMFLLNFILVVRKFSNLPADVAVGDPPFFWIVFPVFTIISPPLLAVLGFMLTIIVVAIYNVITRWLKGLEITVKPISEKKRAQV